jgi:TRAP-type C4-dicarboxylate transport system permease small subunit
VSHGLPEEFQAAAAPTKPLTGLLGVAATLIERINSAVMTLGGIALIVACLVLTYSVVVRYALKIPTDWQDETAIFLLVGATFLSGAAVQSRRGHVGIEALASILPASVNQARQVLTDLLSALFCAFFSWKSLTLLHEALVDDQHSSSTWGPPLSIPYGLMTIGMTLLTIQIILQVVIGISQRGDQS